MLYNNVCSASFIVLCYIIWEKVLDITLKQVTKDTPATTLVSKTSDISLKRFGQWSEPKKASQEREEETRQIQYGSHFVWGT